MKTLIYVISAALVFSLILNASLAWKVLDFAISKDHLSVAIQTCQKREITLLRFARAFTSTRSNEDLRQWIQSTMSDLEITAQGDQFIVNGVEIRLDAKPATVE
jgi:hypothetical protein